MARLKTIEWQNDCARIIDQTLLPEKIHYLDITNIDQMYEAIKILQVRGAPAIGVAAAFGLYLGVRDFDCSSDDIRTFLNHVDDRAAYLASSRPTAVNLFWAIDRMRKFAHHTASSPSPSPASPSDQNTVINNVKKNLLTEALRIFEEDKRMCRAIGEHGLELIKDKSCILTHCNAGGLATSEFGTALAPIYVGQERGLSFRVFADETRPLLQGARITALELSEAGIPVTVICDNMAASVMSSGQVQACIVGADRIAANGDAANKIGTFGVAIMAAYHNIPFYVAAPSSTFDLSIPSGAHIPIEERGREEVALFCGVKKTVPDAAAVFNPSFDVTPSKLIAAIVTERGVIYPPFAENIAKMLV